MDMGKSSKGNPQSVLSYYKVPQGKVGKVLNASPLSFSTIPLIHGARNRFLVWMLCFSRQFWSSISRADYMALQLGFLTKQELHLAYDFHSYMLRSMDDEFWDIVGIRCLT